MSDKMREGFENWCAGKLNVDGCDEFYFNANTNLAWVAWQASRAAMVHDDNQVTAEDVASLQRYDVATIGVVDGKDYGAEMEGDDEGECILLSDALSLFTKT